jgi:hypothetical protein
LKLWCVFVIVLASTSNLGAQSWKAASFETALDFERKNPTDSFRFEIAGLYDGYNNNIYCVYHIQKNYGTIHLTKTASIVYDGVDLFLNLKKLRISKGFLRIHSPESYTVFKGHPQKDKVNAVDFSTAILTGAIGAAMSQGASEDMKKSVPYVFYKSTGKVHPLITPTMERVLEPFPALFASYRMEANQGNLETMKIYLEILNDMIATEVDN